MGAKDYLTLSLSVLAVVVSLANLYLTQLRRARLELHAGEHLKVNYFVKGNFGAALPVAVTNDGANVGIVLRFGLLMQHADSGEAYLLEPVSYQRLTAEGVLEDESDATPIAVPGRNTAAKNVLFRSSLDRPDEYRLAKAGRYNVTLLAWETESSKPSLHRRFSVEVSPEAIGLLNSYREQKKTSLVWLIQSDWATWGAHRSDAQDATDLVSRGAA